MSLRAILQGHIVPDNIDDAKYILQSGAYEIRGPPFTITTLSTVVDNYNVTESTPLTLHYLRKQLLRGKN